MNIRLKVALLIGILIFTIFIAKLLIQKKLNLKYTLLWLALIFAMLFAVLMPNLIEYVADFFGFITPANFIFVLSGMFTLLIIVSITAIVSHLNQRISCLVQTQAILEKRVRELENKGDHKKNESSNSDISTDK